MLSVLLVVFMILGLAAAASLIILLPKRQVRDVQDLKDRIDLENKLRATYAQIIGAIVLLAGIYFTWTQSKNARDFSTETLRISEQGQITERFSRAIDQLGSDKLTVRLGGIYALERVARDSTADRGQIVEVLTTYVRQNAIYRPERKQMAKAGEAVTHEKKKAGSAMEMQQETMLPADIQAILSVFGRRHWKEGEREGNYIDLKNTDLRNADLWGADLRNINFEGACLTKANLAKANLKLAGLRLANLKEASVSKADLEGADLFGANLAGAHAVGTKLDKASLMLARLAAAYCPEASFREANLAGAMLEKAYLKGAIFEKANLARAYLRGAYLHNANLAGAILDKAILVDSVLGLYRQLPKGVSKEFLRGFRDGERKSANLVGANLHGANLTRARLRAVDLRGANLESTILKDADLFKANLKGAKNLSIDQLCQASSLFGAELDAELQKGIEKACPLRVLEEPKPDPLPIEGLPERFEDFVRSLESEIETRWKNE